jgi:hypothetical protein
VVADAINGADRRVIITVPPGESKSTTVAVCGTLWALSRNPDSKVILASYGDDMTREHSHVARALVAAHADLLGFRLSPDKTATARSLVGTCRIAGHLPAFEQSMVTWQAGQHQPESLAALVVAHDVLVHSVGQQWVIAAPLSVDRCRRCGRRVRASARRSGSGDADGPRPCGIAAV